ncbi:MAG: sodium:proton antiporter [Bacteroidales bacterium]|nr:sodium:proton antiporter [Bacteroidales bacterium]
MAIQPWTMIPFVIMLLLIAVAPLAFPHKWESNKVKLVATLAIAVPTAIYLICAGLGLNLEHQLLFDYVPFIILLATLYVVTGGICVRGDIKATPLVNTAVLALGFGLASFVGTTGAAMLCIRPLLSINSQRQFRTHTVLFFIALVANCGGVLTPLGDPPLFMLYLRGASFTWFFSLVAMWAFVGAVLLVLYYILDSFYYRKESREAIARDNAEIEPIEVEGSFNIVYLILTVLAVVFLNQSYIPAMAEEHCPLYIKFIREIVLCVIMAASLLTTRKAVRYDHNNFTWGPIAEVAILFVGIFTTMVPALLYLSANAGSLGLTEPWQFYYSTGLLSSFLDNTPTAVAFHSVATGMDWSALEGVNFVAGIPEPYLKAIALGAVFFGAMTYIGNGPNFMVKAIAESENIKMPGFFGYMIKFSLIVLLPVYIITQLIFI